MEDDLELRRYIRGLFRRAWLIVLLAALGGAAAYLYTRLRATSYEATTLLAVSRPVYALDLEGVSQNGQAPLRTYENLALSDEVVQQLHDQLQAAGAAPEAPARLRLKLSARAAADAGLLTLSVVDLSGARAAQIANAWAQVILEQNLALYGPNSSQILSYQTQLDTATAEFNTALNNRATFQAQNQLGLAEALLDKLRGQLIGAIDRQVRYPLLAADAQGLLTRLNTQDASTPASTADEAALLLLVAQATETGIPAPDLQIGTIVIPGETDVDVNQQSTRGLQVQINVTGGASSQTVGALAAAVQAFIDDLDTRTAAATSLTETLRPQILEAQSAVAEASRAADEFNRTVAISERQFNNLTGLVSQAKIAAQDAAALVRVASPAIVPSQPNSGSRLVTTAVGVVAGLIIAIVIIVALEWWRTPLAAATPETAKTSAP